MIDLQNKGKNLLLLLFFFSDPPCPEGFTGGNEYHCFLYLNPVVSVEQARLKCLNSQFDQQIGGLGYLVDEEEKRFVVSRILPKDSPAMYLIGEECQDNGKNKYQNKLSFHKSFKNK